MSSGDTEGWGYVILVSIASLLCIAILVFALRYHPEKNRALNDSFSGKPIEMYVKNVVTKDGASIHVPLRVLYRVPKNKETRGIADDLWSRSRSSVREAVRRYIEQELRSKARVMPLEDFLVDRHLIEGALLRDVSLTASSFGWKVNSVFVDHPVYTDSLLSALAQQYAARQDYVG
jgi:regulator of protease activity HflC (stomatin/prohibitin superfamily)